MKNKRFDKVEVGLIIVSLIVIVFLLIAPEIMAGSTSYDFIVRWSDEVDSCHIIRSNAELGTVDTIDTRTNDTLYDSTISIKQGGCTRIDARYKWEDSSTWYTEAEWICPQFQSPTDTPITISNAYKCVVQGWLFSSVTGDALPGATVTFSLDAGSKGLDLAASSLDVLSGSVISTCRTSSTGFFVDTLVSSQYLIDTKGDSVAYNVSWTWNGETFERPSKFYVPVADSAFVDWE